MGNPLRWWKPKPSDSLERECAALEEAKAERSAVQAQWPEVREVAGAMRRYRIENHFAERFRTAYGGHG